MSDADLGNWSYAYNTLGQLTRQTDARDQTSCLYYDSLGRMRGRVQRTDENCAATVADADLASSYVYDPQGRVQSVANANVSRSFSYDSYSRANRVTVTIDSLTRSTSFSYDDYHRPTAVTYHGGEVVTTKYGSPGAAVGLHSSVHGDLVDNVSFDEAGRMTALRLPAAGNLWRTQSYYPWTVKRNGGMLESLKVGLSEGGGERLSRSYAYNSFGDISALTEETTSYTFGYDGLGRLTSAYGRTYSYDGAERSATGDLRTDHTFTGQKRDATGLMYYNARYYDPALGTFISPDSMVPNPASVIDHNRFLYARGNPLKYTDPTGYSSHEKQCSTRECWEKEFYWKDRWYRAHGYRFNKYTNHWSTRLTGGAEFADRKILDDVLAEAGISTEGNWKFDELKLLGQGVVAFGQKIGGLLNAGVTAGFDRLKTLIGGGVTWYRAKKGPLLFCRYGAVCALESGRIGFYDSLFTATDSYIRATAVHELAHKIEGQCGVRNDCAEIRLKAEGFRITRYSPIKDHRHYISNYAWSQPWEYWAEAVAVWVYGAYKPDIHPDIRQKSYMANVFAWVEGIIAP